MEIEEKFSYWLENVKTEAEVLELKNMTQEQKDLAFFKDIEFGTAGMRGIVGLGSNYMNNYTVGKVTQAIALYMKKTGKKAIAISYDSRNMSFEFAKLASEILVQNGILVYLSNGLMPTPFLSYMVRFYGCDKGIMITASHNPKEYNGYKVYDENGCQLLEEPSSKIMKIAEKIDQFDIKKADFDKCLKQGQIKLSDSKILKRYEKEVMAQSKEKIENIKVLFTALNGTGATTIPSVLKQCGAEVVLDEIQCLPDKNFTTCEYPNPENIKVYEHAEPLAKKCLADLIIASDPDADRIGVKVLHKNEYVYLTGNQIGALIEDYLLSLRKKKGGIIVRSIVTSSLADKIAEKYGAKIQTVLTGFKYVGEFIRELEIQGKEKDFVLAFEESHGYLAGTYVRDKDATVASMLIAEVASNLKKKNKTLVDKVNEIFDEFGCFEHEVFAYRFEGESGLENKQKILKSLRTKQPKFFGELKVISVLDYLKGVDDLPKSNVLEFQLEQGAKVIIRPSGTEPLIKVYLTLAETKEKNEENRLKVKDSLKLIFN